MFNVGRTFLRVAGVCSIAAPLVILTADVLRIFGGYDFVASIGLWLAFVFFVPAVFGLTYLEASGGSRIAIAGGLFAFFGAMAGAAMQVLFRVYAVLAEQGSLETIRQLRGTFKLVATTQMIGLAWPIGLVLLAIGYYTARRSVVVPLLLAAAAVLFPIGRIAGSDLAVIGSGLLFIAVFGMAGKDMIEGGREMD